MSGQHTPGPWSVEKPNQSTPHIWVVADNDNGGVAKLETCNYDDGLGERHTEEDWANARLVAAAPDLLFALVNLLAVHNGEGGTQYHAGEIASAAIVKATRA